MTVEHPVHEPRGAEGTDERVVEHVEAISGVAVGDDGSATSRGAVLWAAEDAARRGAALHIVRCWQLRSAPRPSTWEPGFVPALLEWQQAVVAEMERTWGDLRNQVPALHLHAVHGDPVRALLEASDGAHLVVVGSRHRSELTELLTGSIADRVTRGAGCPVVVVRPGTVVPLEGG